jgi:hypothetical protein
LFWGCFAAYIPDLKIRLNVSDATFGLLLLCNALGLLSSMWLAPKIDNILGNRGLQIGTALFAATFFLPGSALGVSVIGPLGLALVGKYVPNHLRTEAISRVAILGFAGFFLAPTMMGLISEMQGLRVAFLCAALLSLISIPLILLLSRFSKV